VLKSKHNINGPAFNRVLKLNHIQPSVFAFQTQIELAKVKNTLNSKKSVPKIYIDKLEEIFNVTENS